LLAVLDLLHLVADGLFLVFDLDDRMARLSGIEHNAGTELCVRDGRQQSCESHRKQCNDDFAHGGCPPIAVDGGGFRARRLLLRPKDLPLNFGEVIGLRFAPFFLGLSLGFDVGHLRGRQLFPGQHSRGS